VRRQNAARASPGRQPERPARKSPMVVSAGHPHERSVVGAIAAHHEDAFQPRAAGRSAHRPGSGAPSTSTSTSQGRHGREHLAARGVGITEAREWIAAAADVFDLTKIRPRQGLTLRFERGTHGLESIRYEVDQRSSSSPSRQATASPPGWKTCRTSSR
jgi:hypothetical protein